MVETVKRTVTFSGDSSGKQVKSFYEKLIGKLADKWDINIEFCLCHGRSEVVPQEMNFDKFYIFVQLLPKEFEGIKKHQVSGFTINSEEIKLIIKDDGVQPCPQGDSLMFTKAPEKSMIITDDLNVPMAAVYEGNLYILNDFIHCRSKEELDISVKIFEYVINEAVEKAEVLKYLKAGVEEKSKRALENALKSQFVTRLDKESIQLKATIDTMISYEKGITDCSRKAVASERIIEAIKRNMTDVPTALDKTWKSLAKLNNSSTYEKISFIRTGLKAITRPIFIKFNNVVYSMGRYEVNMGFDGQVKVYAIDHKVDGTYDHPHISNGALCWGNFQGQIPKLIGSSEFDVALAYIYEWLGNYNSGSPYKTIDHWPKVEETVTK